MAFELDYTISELGDNTGFTLTDLSPWGVGTNPLTTNIVSASLTWYFTDADTLLPDNTTFVTFDIFTIGYPTSLIVTILNTTLGMTSTDKFNDGYYTLVINLVATDTIIDVDIPYEFTKTFGVKGQVTCCIDKQFQDLGNCGCNVTEKIKTLLRAKADLYAVDVSNGDCGDYVAGAVALQHAIDICNKKNCSDC